MAKCVMVACRTPQGESPEQQHVIIRKQLVKQKLCSDVGFMTVPNDLRFSNFDDLLMCADNLEKEDPIVESILKKTETLAHAVDPSELMIHFQGRQVPIENYVSRFQWDNGRFPCYNPIGDNLKTLSQLVKRLGDDIMMKASAYADLNNKRLAMKNDAESTYLYRDLTYVITPEVVDDPQDFVETEHLTTMVVFVPVGSEAEWLDRYMTLSDFVVPNSAKMLNAPTSGHTLWRIFIFKSQVAKFTEECEALNYIAKEFVYSEDRYRVILEERSKLEAESHRQEAFLSRIYRVAFSDMFVCWMHIKAMRAFCEAVLKFGLPAKFTCLCIWPTERTCMNAMKESLDALLPRISINNHKASNEGDDMEEETEYESFISFTFNIVGM